MAIIRPYPKAKIADISSRFSALEPWRAQQHTGTDFWFRNCYGTPLVAVEDCIINKIITPDLLDNDYASLKRGYGIEMIGDSDWGYLYWHCLPFFAVKEGDMVRQGKIVGWIGNSGMVYYKGEYVPLEIRTESPHLGAHLHAEKYKWISGKKEYHDITEDMDWKLPVVYDRLDWLTAIRVALLRMKVILGK